jgi:spore coat polysaccharide biosynthesis predicted glycosyltransferase SpsG
MRSEVRVVFRVAAGPRIGFGHLMRCRALGRTLGVRPLLSIRGTATTRKIARRLGCACAPIARTLADADVIVVDDPSPAHAQAWLRRGRRAGTPTVVIHDRGVGSAEADLVVDGSITVRPTSDTDTRIVGPRFALLDRRILRARAARARRIRARPRPRVLIALGGGAYVHTVVRSLVREIASRRPDALITVAAGFCPARRRPSLAPARWIERLNGLAKDLAACDVAVVAGGITLYEACAIGVPAVALAVVPAQRDAIAAFAARGVVLDAGSLGDGERALRNAAAGVARSLREATTGRRASAARRLIDGRGALRVAARIRRLVAGARSKKGRHA